MRRSQKKQGDKHPEELPNLNDSGRGPRSTTDGVVKFWIVDRVPEGKVLKEPVACEN